MSEGERVRLIRKANKLTLEKFGKQFGMGASSISDIENGRRALTNQTRISICREFNVDEKWLRTGEGEMTVPEDSFDLEEYIKRRGVTDLEIKILKAYFDLDSDLREKLLQHFKDRLSAEQKMPTPVSESGPKNADEESFMRDVTAMSPGQQEQLFDQYDSIHTTREQQKDASTASVQSASDDKAPESAIPDQS